MPRKAKKNRRPRRRFVAPAPAAPTTAPRRPLVRRKLRQGLLAIGVSVGLVLVLSWALRTEPAIGGLADRLIATATQDTGLRVVRGRIAPAGWTGIEIRDLLVRRPDQAGSIWLAAERVHIRPDLNALVRGEFRVKTVYLHGAEANIEIGPKGHGDLALLHQILRSRRATPTRDTASSVTETARKISAATVLPTVVLTRTQVRIRDTEGRIKPVVIDSERLRIGSLPGRRLFARGDMKLGDYDLGHVDANIKGYDEAAVTIAWKRPQDLTKDIAQSHPRAAQRSHGAGAGCHRDLAPHGFAHRDRGHGPPGQSPVESPRPGPRSGTPCPSLASTQTRCRVSRWEDTRQIFTREALARVLLPGRPRPGDVPLGHPKVSVDRGNDVFRVTSDIKASSVSGASTLWSTSPMRR